MRKLIAEGIYFYSACPSNKQTYRIKLRLPDEIDGEILQKAADLTIRRYPYYAVKCCKNEREYYLESNDEPFVVYNTKKLDTIGGKSTNGYLIAVSYWEDIICLNVFHGLADGAAAMEFLRTLSYYYCCERYDSSLPPEKIRVNGLTDDKIPDEELYNPYISIMNGERKLPVFESKSSYQVKKAFDILSDARVHQSPAIAYKMRIPEDKLMCYCHEQDGTPGVVFSLLLSRALCKLNPDVKEPVVTGMAMNLRPALGALKYNGSPIALAFLPYDEKIREFPFTKQATIYRGRLILASDKDKLLSGVADSCKLYTAINNMPDINAKKELSAKVCSGMASCNSLCVSYVGPAKLGPVEKYVKELQLENVSGGRGITVEVMAANGYFYLNFAQEWEEELYFKAFCDELQANGIEYEVLERSSCIIPDIELP